MFGKKKTHAADHENQTDLGKPATASGRALLLLSILLGLLGCLLLIIGAAMLQHRLHNGLLKTLRADGTSDFGTYRDAFQSAHYTPYPDSTTRQWMFVWFLMSASVFVFVLTLLITLSAVRIVQMTPALIGLHTYVLVFCTFAIDTFLWINHHKVVRDIFGRKRIALVLAGIFLMAIGHGLSILALGLTHSPKHIDSRHSQNSGVTERIIEKQVHVPVSAPRETHDTHDTHFERREMPTFTNNPAQPVRVHQGGTHLTDANPSGSTEPVKVHMGNVIPHASNELGSRHY